MQDDRKTKKQLIAELVEARCQLAAADAFRATPIYRHLFEQLNGAVLLADAATGKLLDCNWAAVQLLGRDRAEIIGMHQEGIHPPHTADEYRRRFAEHVAKGRGADYEGEVIRKDGRIVPVQISAVPVELDGRAMIFGLFQDISARVTIEQTLRESEARYRIFFEQAPDGILIADIETRKFLYANPAAAAMFGCDQAELLRLGVEDIHPPEALAAVVAEFMAQARGEKLMAPIIPCRRRDGTVFFADIKTTMARLDGRPCNIGFFTDVTLRQQAEIRLAASEARFRELVDLLPLIVFEVDLSGRLTFVNRQAFTALGYRKASLPQGLNLLDFLVLGDRDRAAGNMQRLFRGEAAQANEYRLQRKDGSSMPVISSSSVIFDQGRPVGLRGVILDISDRKLAEENLRRERDKLQGYLDVAGVMLLALNDRQEVAMINRKGCEILGLSEEEIVGRNWFKTFLPPEQRDEVAVIFDRLLAGEVEPAEYYENPVLAADGRLRMIAWHNTVLREGDHVVGLLSSGEDITLRRQMEEELAKVQKLESVGLLAGGIAHDFNNLLTAILGNISLAKEYIRPEDALFPLLDDSEKASFRARDLTRQLLTFARGGVPVTETAALGNLIRDSAAFVLRGSSSTPDFFIPEDLWMVKIDKGQINQVIQNLVINAEQSMPRGGLVSVRCENVQLGPDVPVPLPAGDYVRVSVRDQGSGIPPENIGKVFDPYFTTKSGGSGLGLATVHSILRSHNGHISVETSPGGGTAFHVYLPALPFVRPVVSLVADRHELAIGPGRILVMDDESIVCNVVAAMLEKMGFAVDCVVDGSEALDLYFREKEAGRPYDVVVMDVTIPGGMGGEEAVARLLAVDPQARVIVASGYSRDPIVANFREYGFRAAIAKPFTVQDLSNVLREVLGQ